MSTQSIRTLGESLRRCRKKREALEKTLALLLTEIESVAALKSSQAVLDAKNLIKDVR